QAALAQVEADQLGDPGLLSEVYRLKGRLAEREERWEEAAAAYEEGIRHRRDPEGLIPLHRHRALCLHRLGRLEEAIESARQAVALLEKRGDTPRDQLAKAYSELALILKDAGRLEEAQEVSLRSL